MSDQRKNIRYPALAKAVIREADEGEILLKDISVIGCRVECANYIGVINNARYKLEVIPENVSKIGAFDLTVQAKWIRTGNRACEIGFSIVESPKGKLFQRYVDYLSWQSAKGGAADTGPEN